METSEKTSPALEERISTRLVTGPAGAGEMVRPTTYGPVASAIDRARRPSREPSTEFAVVLSDRGEAFVGGADPAKTVATIRAKPAAAASSLTGHRSLVVRGLA